MSDSIPQLGDPFSAAASQQTAPGFLGQSPAFWQHLAMFGGNLVQGANARTPSGHLANGTGFAGPFGAAIGATAQQAQEQALSQSNIGRNQAEITGANLNNRLKQAQMPAELLRAQFQTNALQDPGLMTALGYSGGSGSSAPYTAPSFGQQPSGGGNAPAFEAGVHQNESGGSMAPGIKGDGGQASGPMQVHADALKDVNSAFGTNLTPQQLTQWPELGKWAGDRYLALQQQKFGPVNGVAAYNAGPGRTQQAIAGQAPLPASTVGYVQRATGQQPSVPQSTGQQPQAPQAPQPSAGGGPGDSLLQQADVLTNRANRIAQAQAAAKSVGLSPGPLMAGDTGAMHTQAQQLREQGLKLNGASPISLNEKGYNPTPGGGAAPIPGGPADPKVIGAGELAKDRNQTKTIRGPGSAALLPSGDDQPPTIIQSPLEKKILGPDNREWSITQNAVEDGKPYTRPPGVPDWAPPGTLTAVPQGLSPTEEASQKESSEDAFGEKANHAYQGALVTRANMDMVRQNLAELNDKPNFLSTGQGTGFRQALAKTFNGNLAALGLPTMFDPDKIAAGESLEHQAKLGGMQATSALLGASHEAASIVQGTQSAFPNHENSPQGARLLAEGIDNAAAYTADRHTFLSNWAVQHPGQSMVGADTAFQKLRPAQSYTRRAISVINPYAVSGPDEMKRYLPGTRVYLKGGSPQDVRMVPGEKDLPPASQPDGSVTTPGQP